MQTSDLRLMTEESFLSKAAQQDGRLNNHETRVESLETLGGISPGDPVDATMTGVAANPESGFANELATSIGERAEQFDYVDALAARSRTNRLLLTKSGAGAGGSFEVAALSDTDHITATISGLTGDKYHRIWETWHGALTYTYANEQRIEQRYLTLTGVWTIAEGQNAYTTQVGATFSLMLNLGHERNEVGIRTYKDNRGGIWRLVLTGAGQARTVDDSAWSSVSGYTQRNPFTDLPAGAYVLTGTFMGDDPAHVPSSGAGTARGWVATTDATGANVNRHAVFGLKGTPAKARDTLVAPVSNWDIALLIKPAASGTFQWVPEHEGIISTAVATPAKYYDAGKPVDLDGMAVNDTRALSGDFEMVQHVYGRNTATGTANLVELWTSHRFHPDGRITVTGRWKALQDIVVDSGYVMMLPVTGSLFDTLVTSVGNSYPNPTNGTYETLTPEGAKATSYAFLSSTRPEISVAVRFDNAMETMRRGKAGKPNGTTERAAFIDHGTAGKSKLYQQLFNQGTSVPAGTVHRFSGEFARVSAPSTRDYLLL